MSETRNVNICMSPAPNRALEHSPRNTHTQPTNTHATRYLQKNETSPPPPPRAAGGMKVLLHMLWEPKDWLTIQSPVGYMVMEQVGEWTSGYDGTMHCHALLCIAVPLLCATIDLDCMVVSAQHFQKGSSWGTEKGGKSGRQWE